MAPVGPPVPTPMISYSAFPWPGASPAASRIGRAEPPEGAPAELKPAFVPGCRSSEASHGVSRGQRHVISRDVAVTADAAGWMTMTER